MVPAQLGSHARRGSSWVPREARASGSQVAHPPAPKAPSQVPATRLPNLTRKRPPHQSEESTKSRCHRNLAL